jgi:hypothetical protein
MTLGRSLERHLSLCLITMLVLPVGAIASTPRETAPQTSSAGQQSGQNTKNPAEDKDVGAPASASPDSSPSVAQTVPLSQTSQSPGQTSTPLGTAAAPDTRLDGVPASSPSGAAIAPARQRRVRRFSIRTALVVGAVVAVGVIAGLSLASPSRP